MLAIVVVIGGGAVAGTVTLLRLIGRAVAAEANRTRRTVATPSKDAVTRVTTDDTVRVRVGAVLSIDEEMLVELRPDGAGEDAEQIWLTGPSSIAALVTLGRWRDAGVVVSVTGGPGRFLFHTDQARVTFTGRAPTA